MQPVGTAQPRPGTGGPAEYPEGGDWSVDARRLAWRWPWPGPQEYPIDRIRTSALLGEVLRLRQRMYQLETQQFIAAFRGGRGSGWNPAEYPVPESGDGGGGGGGVIPIPPHEIAEYPVPELLGQLATLVDRLAHIETRLIEIETRLQLHKEG